MQRFLRAMTRALVFRDKRTASAVFLATMALLSFLPRPAPGACAKESA